MWINPTGCEFTKAPIINSTLHFNNNKKTQVFRRVYALYLPHNQCTSGAQTFHIYFRSVWWQTDDWAMFVTIRPHLRKTCLSVFSNVRFYLSPTYVGFYVFQRRIVLRLLMLVIQDTDKMRFNARHWVHPKQTKKNLHNLCHLRDGVRTLQSSGIYKSSLKSVRFFSCIPVRASRRDVS